jgi:hypothetical protein
MKALAVIMVAGALGAGAGLAGCTITAPATAPAPSRTPLPASSASAPAPTKTVIKTVHAAAPTTPAAAPSSTAAPQAPAAQQQSPEGGGPNVTDPWAVVSAYYGDIESGNYAQAYALLGHGAPTGQSYDEFVAGFACTGGQTVSENWESGDQVNFDLAAGDNCTGATDYYTGTDTVENGTIVAANVTQTG